MEHLSQRYLIRYACLVPLVTLFAASTACSTWYYGYSSEQWEAMSEHQKTEAQADYAQVLQAKQTDTYELAIDARKDQVIKKGITGNSGPMQSIQPLY